MNDTAQNGPVVILGMHRSGTSLLTRMLDERGLFIGHRKTLEHEARFFRHMNNWILSQLGVAWDDPGEFERIAADPRLRPLLLEHLAHYVRSPQLRTFLGWGGYLRHRNLDNLPFPWGWKDPRNTLTLDLWAELFPSLRVVHVTRHGVDVAASIRARQEHKLAVGSGLDGRRRLVYAFSPRRSLLVHTVRGLDLMWGFRLWERYLKAAEDHLTTLNVPRLDVRYEDLLEDPEGVLARVVEFCALPAATGGTPGTEKIRANRRFAFRRDPELVEFAGAVEERLRVHGYEP